MALVGERCLDQLNLRATDSDFLSEVSPSGSDFPDRFKNMPRQGTK